MVSFGLSGSLLISSPGGSSGKLGEAELIEQLDKPKLADAEESKSRHRVTERMPTQ